MNALEDISFLFQPLVELLEMVKNLVSKALR